MTWQIAFILILLLATFAAMVWEKWSVDLVALGAMALLLVFGILTARDAFTVFSNEAVITVACMFILSAGLETTGVIDTIAQRLSRLNLKSDVGLLLVTLPLVALISAFVNNTPVVVVFMPIMVSLAASRGIKPSKLLIPLSFAAIFGGSCTLIGTSTNILVSTTAEAHGQPPLGMFELLPVGIVLAGAGLAYLLTIGRWLLPGRETLSSILQTTEAREYFTEAFIAAGSPLIGKKIPDTALKSIPNSRILDVTRAGTVLLTPLDQIELQQGDRLRITTVLSGMMEMKDIEGLKLLPQAGLGLEPVGLQKAVVVESVIGPASELIGRSIRQINFRQRYGILIMAVHRQGQNLRQKFQDVRLNIGDTILMEGTEAAIDTLRADRGFLLLATPPAVARRRDRMWLATGIVAALVVLAVFNILSIGALAFIAAVAMVATRCIALEDAYRAVNWKVVSLILGTLALGLGLERTGGARWLSHELFVAIGGLGPRFVLSAVFALASLLTTFLSNNAVAVLLTPIVIEVAGEMGIDSRPLIIALALGASASFATPVGYQTNTLVYGAGGYRFSDFVKVGLPLNILFWLIATWLVPVFWPL